MFCELFFWTELKKNKQKKNTDALTTSLYNSTHTLTDLIYEHFYSGFGSFENYERTRVFTTQSYDSAKGWDFTQSPCFYFPASLQYEIMGWLYITFPLTPER